MLEHREAVAGMSVLLAIAQAGSLTAAARKLGLTSSAVSKQVTRLEARLGTRLLHRTTRRVQLTEAGERYCERARLALEWAYRSVISMVTCPINSWMTLSGTPRMARWLA